MANNRMYLTNKRTGDKVCIAKYYPSVGWGTFQDTAQALNNAFERNEPAPTPWGDNDWRIEYEHAADPAAATGDKAAQPKET